MKTYNFVISYDIRDIKRLRRVAKILEQEAMRFQYSIFIYYDATYFQLKKLLEKLVDEINENEDDLRVYRINSFGLALGSAINLSNPMQII